MSLLSICGDVGLHVYIAQVSLWRGYEYGLPMILTKWFMTKVVVKERVLIWLYEVCKIMYTDKWMCYDLFSMLCLV